MSRSRNPERNKKNGIKWKWKTSVFVAPIDTPAKTTCASILFGNGMFQRPEGGGQQRVPAHHEPHGKLVTCSATKGESFTDTHVFNAVETRFLQDIQTSNRRWTSTRRDEELWTGTARWCSPRNPLNWFINLETRSWSAENLIRSGSIPTNTSFFFPVGLYKRLGVSFLVSHNKIIRTMTSSTAQWDRIGTVAGPSNAFGIDPYRHQFHFPSWIIKKPLGFRF